MFPPRNGVPDEFPDFRGGSDERDSVFKPATREKLDDEPYCATARPIIDDGSAVWIGTGTGSAWHIDRRPLG